LYKKISPLDPSPSFANAVEKVEMVNKTLTEIGPRKEFWNIKVRVTKLWDETLLIVVNI
jgi:hypothetical protein